VGFQFPYGGNGVENVAGKAGQTFRQQYWKGSLVDDLRRLIDVGKLDGREMCRVVRVLYDYLDVEQFGELLERMGW
jgi:hypothetical protein